MTSSIPIEYEKIFNRPIWRIKEILTGITTPVQSWPRSKGNEVIFHTYQISRTRTLASDAA